MHYYLKCLIFILSNSDATQEIAFEWMLIDCRCLEAPSIIPATKTIGTYVILFKEKEFCYMDFFPFNSKSNLIRILKMSTDNNKNVDVEG